MKKIVLLLILIVSFANLKAQKSRESQIITAIKLEADKIILNDKLS